MARAHLAEERNREVVSAALPGAEDLAGELIDGVSGGAQDRRVGFLRDRIEQAAARAALSEGLVGGLSLLRSTVDYLDLPERGVIVLRDSGLFNDSCTAWQAGLLVRMMAENSYRRQCNFPRRRAGLVKGKRVGEEAA